MCGRYYADDETARQVRQLILQTDEKNRQKSLQAVSRITAEDIYPGREAPVISEKDGSLCCEWQRWGFPGFEGKKLIFNARCRTALEKPLFRDSLLHRRVVIPASGFYEWNKQKEKHTFHRSGMQILFMAGFCRQYEDGAHFVILTTAANASTAPVHDRMPLILEPQETFEWIQNAAKTEKFLQKTPCLLERKTDYEQLNLFSYTADYQ